MRNSDRVRLSPSEWKVMSGLWLLPDGGSAGEIRDVLHQRLGADLTLRTVTTFLSRIVAKGYAITAPLGSRGLVGKPAYHYRPAVPLQDAVRVEIESFLTSYILVPESLEVLHKEVLSQVKTFARD